jgi:hypothetical protein
VDIGKSHVLHLTYTGLNSAHRVYSNTPHVRRAHVSVKQSTVSYLQECECIVTQLPTGHALLVRKHQASQLLLFPSCNLGLPIIKHYTARSFNRLRLSANDHTHNGRTRQRPLTHTERIDTAQPSARPVVWNNDREWRSRRRKGPSLGHRSYRQGQHSPIGTHSRFITARPALT